MTQSVPTPANIKRDYLDNDSGPFFDRSTMEFFGDKMSSFGTTCIADEIYLYRKPTASVNVFGKTKTAGREFFNAWHWDGESSTLSSCSTMETQSVFEAII